MAAQIAIPSGGTKQPTQDLSPQLDALITELLQLDDERGLDPAWSLAQLHVREYAQRPAKRVRPLLLVAGYELAKDARAPESVWRFAAALELLHTFMLIHDDVADAAELRRGGPALHRLLGGAERKLGEDLAVVAGDHLFALAIEAMLGSGAPNAAAATSYLLQICRHTAAGQFLDLQLSKAELSEVTLFQTLKVANLKTAKYGFSAPLVAGAMLAMGEARTPEQQRLITALDRIGQKLGLAFQLRDDLIGLFGDERVSGKPSDGDFVEGRRTFPVIAAWTRGRDAERATLEWLWSLDPSSKDRDALLSARALVRTTGGLRATERMIQRLTRSSRKLLFSLSLSERGGAIRAQLDHLISRLADRAA